MRYIHQCLQSCVHFHAAHDWLIKTPLQLWKKRLVTKKNNNLFTYTHATVSELYLLSVWQICQNLFMRGLSLVGWYHSHPRGPALPSLQDIDSQMDHQLRLQGSSNGFQPCLGIICGV